MHEMVKPTPSGFYILVGFVLLLYATVRWIAGDAPERPSTPLAPDDSNLRPLPELERDMAIDKVSAMWERGEIPDSTYWGIVDDVLSRYERETAPSH